jgi:hypothetical protein
VNKRAIRFMRPNSNELPPIGQNQKIWFSPLVTAIARFAGLEVDLRHASVMRGERWNRPTIHIGELERFFEQLTGTFDNLPRPFCRSNGDILAGRCSAFPNISRRANRMKSNQISGALTDTFRKVAGALTGSLPNVAAAASDITTGASALFLRTGLTRSLVWRCRGLTLAIGAHPECK